jgi:hypothetical protein
MLVMMLWEDRRGQPERYGESGVLVMMLQGATTGDEGAREG